MKHAILLAVLVGCASEPAELACVERTIAIHQGIFGYAAFEYDPGCNCQETRANARVTATRFGVETSVTTGVDGFYELALEPGEYRLCIAQGECEDITVAGGLSWWDYSPGLGLPAWRPVGCAFED